MFTLNNDILILNYNKIAIIRILQLPRTEEKHCKSISTRSFFLVSSSLTCKWEASKIATIMAMTVMMAVMMNDDGDGGDDDDDDFSLA